jgi:molecular chaperone GrpE
MSEENKDKFNLNTENIGSDEAVINDESTESIDNSSDEFINRDVNFNLSPEEKLKAEIKVLAQELKAQQDKYLRTMADMDNLRKRHQKERTELIKYQGEPVVADLLGVLDNLELALQHKEAAADSLRTGLEMVHKQFVEVFEKWGIKSETALGQLFDPQKHNALNKVPSPEAKSGEVVAELKKTYFYKDKLLRVGDVVVAE